MAAGAVVLGTGGPVRADEQASRTCRKAIAAGMAKVNKVALSITDKCHKTQDKVPAAGAPCNVMGSPEWAVATYQAAQAKALASIGGKCQPGDPVLENYEGGDPAAVFAFIDEAVKGNSAIVQGDANLQGDKAKAKCVQTVAKWRSKIADEILKDSNKCQKTLDAAATAFGTLDASCVDAGAANSAVALVDIPAKCAGLTDLGNCSPLPGCAIDSTVTAFQDVARAIYSTEGGHSCGDAPIGTRVVHIAIDTPQTLAGVRIDLDYPQFEAGIPGTDQSDVVKGQVAVLQGNPADYIFVANDRDDTALTLVVGSAAPFLTSGALFDVSMDSCVALAQNICNRNQNVYGCCPSGNTGNCFANPPACTAFDPALPNVGTPAGCCPADNACTTQTLATGCSVSSPVDEFGQPVAGVTCSVTITGS